ncbi:MAG: serine hydrolase [Deltaproteobacteria bacterium]|nr:serine hydrolase [Deltaproteobacteria bacterium]MBW2414078.1 serine hydrolase [Deltaproteobacteria bacterium]
MSDLAALPPQTAGVPWPTDTWPEAPPGPGVDAARIDKTLDRLFAEPPEGGALESGETRSVLIAHRGRVVVERYGPELGPDSPFPSWSCAKSILHALVGILVSQGKLEVHSPADVPEWQGDGRKDITLDALLRMSSGLAFNEDYVDTEGSDAIRMLFGEGKEDVSAYAAAKPLAHDPDTFFSYSSGTSNVVSSIVRRALGVDESGYREFMHRELFDRLGMRSVDPRFDASGTFIGSSFVFATARDFARFGLLYLRDGIWEGRRILPEGWVDYARTPTPTDPEASYGAHWWLAQDGSPIFNASGYKGQYIVVVPDRDLVLVRTGDSEPEQRGAVLRALAELVRCFGRSV